jgi:hypothetical protein
VAVETSHHLLAAVVDVRSVRGHDVGVARRAGLVVAHTREGAGDETVRVEVVQYAARHATHVRERGAIVRVDEAVHRAAHLDHLREIHGRTCAS